MISMEPRPDLPRPPWEAEATAVWDRAVENRLQEANRIIAGVCHEYGADALLDMMTGWIDVAAQVSGMSTVYGPHNRDVWGADGDWSEAGPEWKWAHDLIVARITGDLNESRRLLQLGAAGSDPEAWTLAVMALLELCVMVCRKIIAGRLQADAAEVVRLRTVDPRRARVNLN